jgi:hypothetical protein
VWVAEELERPVENTVKGRDYKLKKKRKIASFTCPNLGLLGKNRNDIHWRGFPNC